MVYNPGAAFSLGSGATWIFTIVGVLVTAVAIGFASRLRGLRWGLALGLVLGGAVGNLVDRLVNPPSFGQGHVTDFLAYGDLFVGNIADVCRYRLLPAPISSRPSRLECRPMLVRG